MSDDDHILENPRQHPAGGFTVTCSCGRYRSQIYRAPERATAEARLHVRDVRRLGVSND